MKQENESFTSTIIKPIIMKTILLKPAAVVLMLFISSTASYGQTIHVVYSGNEITVAEDTIAQFTLFTGRNFEGKTYLHWNVANQHSDGMYLVYRSADDKEYEMIGQKEGVGVPIPDPIAYYFTDEHPLKEVAFYKLIHFAMNRSVMLSETIRVNPGYEKYFTILK